MNVSQILAGKAPGVITVDGGMSLIEVAAVLDAQRIGAVIVVGPGEEVAGILSERDITREIARRGASALDAPARTAMTAKVVSVTPETTIDQAMAVMTDRRIRHLPVIAGGRLVGVISIGDVVKLKIALTEAEAAAMKDYIHS